MCYVIWGQSFEVLCIRSCQSGLLDVVVCVCVLECVCGVCLSQSKGKYLCKSCGFTTGHPFHTLLPLTSPSWFLVHTQTHGTHTAHTRHTVFLPYSSLSFTHKYIHSLFSIDLSLCLSLSLSLSLSVSAVSYTTLTLPTILRV